MMVSGSVSNTSSGLTKKLRTPSTNAKIIAVVKLSMMTCGDNNFAITYTATAVISMLIISLIILKVDTYPNEICKDVYELKELVSYLTKIQSPEMTDRNKRLAVSGD